MTVNTNVAPEFKMFSDETLAELRAFVEANLPHLCSATYDTKSGARSGGALTTPPAAILANVPCRLVSIKRKQVETMSAAQPHQEDQWALIFRVGVVIPEGALATVTGTDALGQVWSRVVRVGTPEHSRAFEIESRYGARDVNVSGR